MFAQFRTSQNALVDGFLELTDNVAQHNRRIQELERRPPPSAAADRRVDAILGYIQDILQRLDAVEEAERQSRALIETTYAQQQRDINSKVGAGTARRMIEEAVPAPEQVLATLAPSLAEIAEQKVGAAHQRIDELSEATTVLAQQAEDAVNSIQQDVQGLTESTADLAQQAENAANDLADGLQNLAGAAHGALRDLAEATQDGFNRVPGVMDQWARAIANGQHNPLAFTSPQRLSFDDRVQEVPSPSFEEAVEDWGEEENG
jgi:uncharacterized protein YoxC